MWVRFWHSYDRDNPPMDETDDDFVWLHDDHDDDLLKDEALERVPSLCRYNESGRFYYGFERLKELPEKVRNRLIHETEEKIASLEYFLDKILLAGK